MYNKFIATYGSEAKLNASQKGDPKAHRRSPPTRRSMTIASRSSAQAYGELSTTYYSFFNYQRAAET